MLEIELKARPRAKTLQISKERGGTTIASLPSPLSTKSRDLLRGTTGAVTVDPSLPRELSGI